MDTNIIEIKNLPEDATIENVYKKLEDFFISLGLIRAGNKRVFFVPNNFNRDGLCSRQKAGYYFHDAIEYDLVKDSGCRLGLTILPKFVLTKDGITWRADFSKRHSFQEAKLWGYSQFSQSFSNWINFLDSKITLDFDEKGSLTIDLEMDRIKNVSCSNIIEPSVSFHQSTDASDKWPYMGLKRYHPLDFNLGTRKFTNNTIKLALIGTGMSIPLINSLKNGVPTAMYPKFEDIFKANLELNEDGIAKISADKYAECQTINDLKNVYLQTAQKIKESGYKFDILIVELPDEASRFFTGQEIDLHDFIKVAFLKEGIPTQIVTPKILTSTDNYKYADLALGIYVSAGGKPWKLESQPIDTCFIGISFGIKPLSSQNEILVGIAEVFDNFGESVSIRGVSQNYEKSKGYHLSANNFDTLIKGLLHDYNEYRGIRMENDKIHNGIKAPVKIVIHKTSDFDNEEMGIALRLKDLAAEFSLIYITTPTIRLISGNSNMPDRGQAWIINNQNAIFYTDGMVPHLRRYLGVGSPKPFLVIKQFGTDTIENILEQIMMLTKLNWNSTKNHEHSPVTLSHARKIVDMLRAGLESQSIVKDFRYYL